MFDGSQVVGSLSDDTWLMHFYVFSFPCGKQVGLCELIDTRGKNGFWRSRLLATINAFCDGHAKTSHKIERETLSLDDLYWA